MAGALVVVCAAAGGEARASAGGDRGGASVRAPLARVLTPVVTAEDSQALTSTSVTVVASINPNSSPTSYVVDYGPTAAYGQQTASVSIGTGATAVSVTQAITGLTPGTSYHFAFVATNGYGSTDGTDTAFATLAASPPAVTGESAENVMGSAAMVVASITANGVATSYVVNYGTSTAYGQQTAAVSIGSGTAPLEVGQALSGLVPATTYHFQFVVTNAGGTTNGFDTTFTTAAPTPPVVDAESVANVTAASATATASIDPNGAATTYVVDYGTTTLYGQQTSPTSLPAGSTPQQVTQPLSGLLPNTTYHLRFVATNAGGTTDGADLTLTTTPGGGAATTSTSTTTTATTTTTPSPPKLLPPPVRGVSVDVLPALGAVLVNGRPLTTGERVPFGAIVNALHGTLTLESVSPSGKVQSAKFRGAIFQILSAANRSTELVLRGGNFAVCARKGTRLPAAALPTNKTTVVRSLWGNGDGQFVTKGRYAAATVRGTIWQTTDRCDGTLIHVTRDSVTVTNLVTHTTRLLAAGHSLLVKAP
jgi:hypothetical protein